MITSVHAVVAGRAYDTGFHVTTPSPWYIQKYLREAVNHGDTHMVLEVTSHALTQHRVDGIKFRIGILTNITHEHLDWHKTMSAYMQAKFSLFKLSQTVVINRDDAQIYNKALKVIKNKPILNYGFRKDADVNPVKFPFKSRLIGQFNQYNCLAAIAATQILEIHDKYIRQAIEQFAGIPGRMEVIAQKPIRIIVDFAHTPNAIYQALATVRKDTSGRLIHVFGSAALRDRSKRPFMGKASAAFADIIILTEEDYRTEDVQKIMGEIASGIPQTKLVERVPQRNAAIDRSLALAKPGDTVIVTGKGHEQSLARGKREYPWSDGKYIRSKLKI